MRRIWQQFRLQIWMTWWTFEWVDWKGVVVLITACSRYCNNITIWAVVVAQLVEWSLLIPKVRGSNPVIGKIYWTFVYCQLYWKDENKEKRGREWPILKKCFISITNLLCISIVIWIYCQKEIQLLNGHNSFYVVRLMIERSGIPTGDRLARWM